MPNSQAVELDVKDVRDFVERYGAKELFFKPLRVMLAPLIIPVLPKKTFTFDGATLEYLYHRYNMTWACERCVEIPVGRHYVRQYEGRNILEVGNVLSHYGPVSHDIVDKFERGAGIINEDVTTLAGTKTYDLIVSISTFEHVGFDYVAEHSNGGVPGAIAGCRRLLTSGGKIVITVPVGYNPQLDEQIRSGGLGASREIYFTRVGRLEWKTAAKRDALVCRYGSPFPYANAILVAEFSA